MGWIDSPEGVFPRRDLGMGVPLVLLPSGYVLGDWVPLDSGLGDEGCSGSLDLVQGTFFLTFFVSVVHFRSPQPP